jgi:predicted transcriptional regulator
MLAAEHPPKTRIVYQANLNFRLAGIYFDFLIAKGYMTRTPRALSTTEHYELTKRGEQLLTRLQELEDLLDGLCQKNHTERPQHARSKTGPLLTSSANPA